MKNRNWNKEHDWKWQWILVLILVLCIAIWNKAEANISNYNFGPEVVELHIVKNDGMNSHEVYTCRNVRTCYNLYLEKRMKDMSINCATKMYIQRSNGNTMRLKGVMR